MSHRGTCRTIVRGNATARAAALCAVLGLAATALPAAAQADIPDAEASLPPLFVTATRIPQPFSTLLADVTVIGADEIARSGAGSLAQLLQRQPGIEIVQNGGPGGTSGIIVRGTNTNQTLVLVDGLRVSSSSTGTTALEAIALGDIDHIEILRGPASALYGSDAIGGVVQVFTRRGGDATRANASVGYGRDDTWQGSAGVSGGSGPFRGAVQVTGARSDGFNSIVNPANFGYDPDRDGYRKGSVSANGSYEWAAGQSLAVHYLHSRLSAQYDAGDAFDDRTITKLETFALSSVNRLAQAWTSRLTAGEGSDDSVSKGAFGDAPFRTRQRQYAWQNEFDAAPAFAQWNVTRAQATLGVERREERVATENDFAVTSRNTSAVFGAWQVEAGANALQATLRRDESSQFGGRTTGALAYGYRLAPAWRITASYGTAFKPPSFNDLYFPGFSNVGLAPETSRNLEGSLAWSGGAGEAKLDASLVVYRNRLRDMIVFLCDTDFNCTPQNVERANITGATLAGAVAWRDTTLRASLDVASPKDEDTGNLLPRRARSHGTLQVSQRACGWLFGVEAVVSGPRYDNAENTRRMGGYGVVNLTAERALAKGMTLFVRIDNVADKNYELAADFATGGVRYFGGLRWAL